MVRVKELGPGDPVEEKPMTVDEQDDSSLAQQNSALAMLRTGNVSTPRNHHCNYYSSCCIDDCCNNLILATVVETVAAQINTCYIRSQQSPARSASSVLTSRTLIVGADWLPYT